MSIQIPTPVLGLIVLLACIASATALIVAGEKIPGSLETIATIALGATFGGAIPVIGGKVTVKPPAEEDANSNPSPPA